MILKHSFQSVGTKELIDYFEEYKDQLPKLERLIASDQFLFETYKHLPSSNRTAPLAHGHAVPFADEEEYEDARELHHPQCRLQLNSVDDLPTWAFVDRQDKEDKCFTDYFDALRFLRLTKVSLM